MTEFRHGGVLRETVYTDTLVYRAKGPDGDNIYSIAKRRQEHLDNLRSTPFWSVYVKYVRKPALVAKRSKMARAVYFFLNCAS